MKKILLFGIFALMMLVTTLSASASDLEHNLVNYYTFDDANWASPEVEDVHGTFDITAIGLPATGYSGILGESFYFDGVDDHIYEVDFFSTFQGTKTISFWYKIKAVNQSNGDRFMISRTSGTTAIFIYTETNGIRGGHGSGQASIAGSGTFDETWHHYAMVYNSSSGDTHNYIDGVLEQTISTGQADLSSTHDNLNFAEDNTGTNGLEMFADEMGFWSTDLSTSQIQELYNGGNGLAYSSFNSSTTPDPLNFSTEPNITGQYNNVTGLQFNFSLNSTEVYDCGFVLNGTQTQLLSGMSAGHSAYNFNTTYVEDTNEKYEYYINCTDVNGSSENTTLTYFNVTNNYYNTSNIDLLFSVNSSGGSYTNSQNIGSAFFGFVNWTLVSDDSPITDSFGSCDISFSNGSIETMGSNLNFTVCNTPGCDATNYTTNFTSLATSGANMDYAHASFCSEQNVLGDPILTVDCSGGQYSETIDHNLIPLCSTGSTLNYRMNTSVCIGQSTVNVSVSLDENLARRKEVTNLNYDRQYDIDTSSMLYNSSESLWYVDHPHEYYILGDHLINVTCENTDQRYTNNSVSENVTILSVTPSIVLQNVTHVNSSVQIAENFSIVYASGEWEWNIIFLGQNLDTYNLTWYNSSDNIVASLQSTNFSQDYNTSDGVFYVDNFTLAIFVNNTNNNITLQNISFSVTTDLAPVINATYPIGGQLWTGNNISGTCSDDVSLDSVYINDSRFILNSSATTSTWWYNWNSTSVEDGTFLVSCNDSLNQVSSYQFNLTVDVGIPTCYTLTNQSIASGYNTTWNVTCTDDLNLYRLAVNCTGSSNYSFYEINLNTTSYNFLNSTIITEDTTCLWETADAHTKKSVKDKLNKYSTDVVDDQFYINNFNYLEYVPTKGTKKTKDSFTLDFSKEDRVKFKLTFSTNQVETYTFYVHSKNSISEVGAQWNSHFVIDNYYWLDFDLANSDDATTLNYSTYRINETSFAVEVTTDLDVLDFDSIGIVNTNSQTQTFSIASDVLNWSVAGLECNEKYPDNNFSLDFSSLIATNCVLTVEESLYTGWSVDCGVINVETNIGKNNFLLNYTDSLGNANSSSCFIVNDKIDKSLGDFLWIIISLLVILVLLFLGFKMSVFWFLGGIGSIVLGVSLFAYSPLLGGMVSFVGLVFIGLGLTDLG